MSEMEPYIPMIPTPPAPNNMAIALFRMTPNTWVKAVEPPIKAEDFNIWPYECLRDSLTEELDAETTASPEEESFISKGGNDASRLLNNVIGLRFGQVRPDRQA